jgi:hypothetical protein
MLVIYEHLKCKYTEYSTLEGQYKTVAQRYFNRVRTQMDTHIDRSFGMSTHIQVGTDESELREEVMFTEFSLCVCRVTLDMLLVYHK